MAHPRRQAVLTALIKSGRFDRAWNALMAETAKPANDNHQPKTITRRVNDETLDIPISTMLDSLPTDAEGAELRVRIVDIVGRSALVEYFDARRRLR